MKWCAPWKFRHSGQQSGSAQRFHSGSQGAIAPAQPTAPPLPPVPARSRREPESGAEGWATELWVCSLG